MAVACSLKYMQGLPEPHCKTGVVICCGGNISDETFRKAEQLAPA